MNFTFRESEGAPQAFIVQLHLEQFVLFDQSRCFPDALFTSLFCRLVSSLLVSISQSPRTYRASRLLQWMHFDFSFLCLKWSLCLTNTHSTTLPFCCFQSALCYPRSFWQTPANVYGTVCLWSPATNSTHTLLCVAHWTDTIIIVSFCHLRFISISHCFFYDLCLVATKLLDLWLLRMRMITWRAHLTTMSFTFLILGLLRSYYQLDFACFLVCLLVLAPTRQWCSHSLTHSLTHFSSSLS